jgi:hypothetical protein
MAWVYLASERHLSRQLRFAIYVYVKVHAHVQTKGFSVATAEIFIMEPKGKKSLETPEEKRVRLDSS